METATQAQELLFSTSEAEAAVLFANLMLVILYVVLYSLLGYLVGGVSKHMMTKDPVPGYNTRFVDKNLTSRQRDSASVRSILLGLFWPVTLLFVFLYGVWYWVSAAFTSLKPEENN